MTSEPEENDTPTAKMYKGMIPVLPDWYPVVGGSVDGADGFTPEMLRKRKSGDDSK